MHIIISRRGSSIGSSSGSSGSVSSKVCTSNCCIYESISKWAQAHHTVSPTLLAVMLQKGATGLLIRIHEITLHDADGNEMKMHVFRASSASRYSKRTHTGTEYDARGRVEYVVGPPQL